MYKFKRILLSTMALILCLANLVTPAFALTVQNAVSGNVAIPQRIGGGEGNNMSTYNSTLIAGYRFSCWRTDTAQKSGYKLGHSINILLNTERADFAGNFGQTGKQAPRILGVFDDYHNIYDMTDKVSVGITEISTDEQAKQLGQTKVHHSTKLEYVTLHYQGNTAGTTLNGKGPSITLTKPLYTKIENEADITKNNSKYGSDADNIESKDDATYIKILSGFVAKDNKAEYPVNKDSGDLYTYIYGERTNSNGAVIKDCATGDGIYTISDVDHKDSKFTSNPSDIIGTDNKTSWTNLNATLIATLCGLTPMYGQPRNGQVLTEREFGMNDYIVVEPIYYVYYYYQRFLVTATDCGLLQADSQVKYRKSVAGNGQVYDDCWDTSLGNIDSPKYAWGPLSNAFPAILCAHVFSTEKFLGLDGVVNAQAGTELARQWKTNPKNPSQGQEKHAFVVKKDGYKIYSSELDRILGAGRVNSRTNAIAYSTYSSNAGQYYTVFAGNNSWWYNGNKYRYGATVTPRTVCESMIGAGTWTAFDNNTAQLAVVYHADENAPGHFERYPMSTSALTLATYDILGNVYTNYIPGNTWSTKNKNGANATFAAGGKISQAGYADMEAYFSSLGARYEGQCLTLHLYATWHRGPVIFTALNRDEVVPVTSLANIDNLKGIRLCQQSSTGTTNIYPLEQRSLGTWTPVDEKLTKEETVGAWIEYTYGDDKWIPYNSEKVRWLEVTEHLVVDFYEYTIEAAGCVIRTTQKAKAGTAVIALPSIISTEKITLQLALGEQIEYSVSSQSNPLAKGEAKLVAKHDGILVGREDNMDIVVGAFQNYSYTNTSAQESDLKEEDAHITTKNTRLFMLANVANLIITPYLDGNAQIPFDASNQQYYYVSVTSDKTVTTYTNNPNDNRFVFIDNASGVVTHPIIPLRKYTIKAIVAGCEYDSSAMKTVYEFTATTEELCDVHYYTTSVTIRTDDKSNHSGISATIWCVPNESADGDENNAYHEAVAEYPTSGSHSGYDCASTGVSTTTMVALKGAYLRIGYNESTQWYNTGKEALTTKITGLAERKSYDYTFAPYHYVYVYKDNASVNPDTIYGNNISGVDNIAADDDGLISVGWKMPTSTLESLSLYNAISVSDNNSNKVQDLFQFTQLDLYNRSQTIYLYYYTASTNADEGYQSTSIFSDSTDLGARTLILDHADIVSAYNMCCDGGWQQTMQTKYNETEYKAAATLNHGTGDDFAALQYVGSVYFPSLEQGVRKNTYRWNSEEKPALVQDESGSNLAITFKQINSASSFTWTSGQQAAVRFTFYINDVPYERLGATIDDMVYLQSVTKQTRFPLTLSIDADNNVIATGSVSVRPKNGETKFVYTLVLGDQDTGAEYEIQAKPSSTPQTYKVDFYTIQTAAGTGIDSTSIASPEAFNDDGWNGTLPYVDEFGAVRSTVLVVFPKSIPVPEDYSSVTIDCVPSENYTFDYWYTYEPNSGMQSGLRYNHGDTSESKTQKETVINMHLIDRPTTVVASARRTNSPDDPGSTPGDPDPDPDPDPGDDSLPKPDPQPPIPVVIVPNTLDYKIVVRTFLDGHLTTPWDNMWVKVRINGEAHFCKVNFGYAVWQDTIFPVNEDPYANKTATVIIAPSQALTGTAAYTTTVDLQPGTVYVDVYYYTQTIRTHVNGVGIAPWNNVQAQYSQTYKGHTVSATTSLGEYGAASVVMMQGTLFSVSGQPTINSTDYKLVVSDHKVIGAHTHVIPYFTVTVNTVCVTKNSSIDCHSVLFNGDKITANDKITVMAGEYDISYATACNTPNAGHNKHTLINAIKGENAVFKVEYKPSSDKEYPFPTITYTGDKRKSLSTLNVNSDGVGTIHVCDETNITLEYSEVDDGKWISVTLYSIPTAVCPSCHKETTAETASVAKTCGQCGAEMLLIMDMSQGFVDNVKPSLHGVTLKYDKAGNIGLSAVVNNAVRLHKDRVVNLTININGTISNENHEVYYATCRTADELKDVLANPANNLRECGVVQATSISAGKYTASLPYSENTYYLYIDGVKQTDAHSVTNRYAVHYEFVKWTEHGKTTPINPTVAIALGQSYAYDAHAKATVVSGANDISDKNDTVDFRDITIHVQTDYENKIPYENFSIGLNNQHCVFPSGTNNITVRVDGSTAPVIFAPASDIANSAYFELLPEYITKNTNVITLEYYTISTEPNGALSPSINGVMTKIVLFGHYIVDGKKYATDQNVQIDVYGEQATSHFRTTRYHFAEIQSAVTGFKWVAKEHPDVTRAKELNTQVVFANKAVQNSGYYYISVTDNIFGDPDYEDGASYICKITSEAVVNAKNTEAHYIYLYAGVPVDIIFDITNNSVSVFASAGATIKQASSTTKLYNGYYKTPDGKRVEAISGVIALVDNNTAIKINATHTITNNNAQSVAFKNWNETNKYKTEYSAAGFTGNLATVTLSPTDKLLTVVADQTKHFKPIPKDNDAPVISGQQQGEIQFIIDTNNTVEITVQAVVSGIPQLPFADAEVNVSFDAETQKQMFDKNGVAKFYIPIGATYSFDGASVNQFAPYIITPLGFSTQPDSVSFENKKFQATENATYYVLYFKVDVKARENIQNVTVHSSYCTHGRTSESEYCITHNTHASAIFQYGTQAGHSATPQSKYNEIKIVVRVNDRPTKAFEVRLVSTDGKQIIYSDAANSPENTFLFTNISSDTTYKVQVRNSAGIWLNTTRSVSLDNMSGRIIWECSIAPQIHDERFNVLQDTTCYAEVQSVAPEVVELYYYTLTLDGDEGIASTSQMAGNNMHQLEGNLYLTGTEVSIGAVVKNINDTQETRRIGVAINIDGISLDRQFSELFTVVLAKDNTLYPTKYDEQTQKFVSEDTLPMGKYIVTVKIAGYTLLVNQFEVEYAFAPAAYEWRTWTEGHTPACGYNPSCVGSIVDATTNKQNTVIINHETRLVATTTKAEIDSVVTGDAINLINVRLDGDNGIQSIVFADKEYTLSENGYFAHVLVPAEYSTQLSANVKAPHFVDESIEDYLSVQILLDDNILNDVATVYLKDEDDNKYHMVYNEDTRSFQTEVKLKTNSTYTVMVGLFASGNEYNVGTINPKTERVYEFDDWTEEGTHYCVFHEKVHDCGACTTTISNITNGAAQNFTAKQQFVNLKATTTYQDVVNNDDNKFYFCTLQVDADEGIESVTINGETYEIELPVDGLAQLPHVIVPAGANVTLNATVRDDVQNHPDAKTHVTFTLQLSDNDVPNGAYDMWLENSEYSSELICTPLSNGAYTYTTRGPLPAGTYAIVDYGNNKTPRGYVTITSERQYAWNEWTNSDNYVCRHCKEEHDVMIGVDSLQIDKDNTASAIAVCKHFTYVVARTIITDTFKFDWNGIPDSNLTYDTYSISQLLDDEPFSDAPFELSWNKGNMMVFPSKQSVWYGGKTYTKEYSYLGVDVNGEKWYLRFDDNTVYIDIPAGTTDEIEVYAHLSVDTLEEIQARVDNFDYNWFSFDTIYTTLTSDNKHITIPFYSLTLNFYLNDEKWTSITQEIADQLLDNDFGDMLVDTGTMTVIGLSAYNPYSDSFNSCWLPIRLTSLAQQSGCNFISPFDTKHIYDFKYYTVQVDHFGGFNSITTALYYDNRYGQPVSNGNTEIVDIRPYYYMYALSLDPSKVNFETCLVDQNHTRERITFNAEASYQIIGWNESNASDFENHVWDGIPESTDPQYTINLNELTAPVYLTAHAKTKYIERHYLATKTDALGGTLGYDFSAGYNDDDQKQFWFKAYEQEKIVEVNRYASNSESPTVSIPAPAYTHFYGYKTIINSENGRTDADGVVSTNLVIRADGTSYVDFYFRKNGTVDGPEKDKTPNTPELPDERVTITYVMNGGQYNGSDKNYSETHTKGTNITLITPTPPKGLKFVGWFLINGTEHIPFSGGIGTSGNDHLLLRDTTVYAAYMIPLDLGITANDIYGSIKYDNAFTTSATIINHGPWSVVPDAGIKATLTIRDSKDKTVYTHNVSVVVPGAESLDTPATQLVWAEVPADTLAKGGTYTIEWTISTHSTYNPDDNGSNNDSSKLNSFTPGAMTGEKPLTRPGYESAPPSAYNPKTSVPGSYNTAFHWEYWTYENHAFKRNTSGNSFLDITILLKPENSSGLRTYTSQNPYGFHDYTTRSGYGLSLHTAYSSTCTHTDKGGQKHNTNYMQSQITFKSDLADNLVGTLDAYMIFPEYNYKSYDSKNEFVSSTHKVLYHKIAIDETTGALKFTEYADYPSTDENDKFAHYTPVWLPDGEYKPVTHIGGLWTPIGECTAQVRQGDINTYLGIYSNKIIIDGSMYDDMYDNH